MRRGSETVRIGVAETKDQETREVAAELAATAPPLSIGQLGILKVAFDVSNLGVISKAADRAITAPRSLPTKPNRSLRTEGL